MTRAVLAACVILAAAPARAAPEDLTAAIAAFRAGDCPSARARVDRIAARDVRTQLWRAGIAQRCGDVPRAEQIIAELLAADPDVRVDLTEWWPSLAEVVDAARDRLPPAPASAPAPAATPAADAAAAADAPTLSIDVGLVAAGHAARFAGVATSWQGSGLAARAARRGERAFVEAAGRAVAYGDSGNDPLAGGGWELALELRAGVATVLAHDRVRLAALAVAVGNVEHLVSNMAPVAARRYAGVGASARAELAATRAIVASAELGYLPLGGIAADTATASPTQVVSRLALAWRAAASWQIEASYEADTLRYEAGMPTGAMAMHTDDVMRVMLALGYAR